MRFCLVARARSCTLATLVLCSALALVACDDEPGYLDTAADDADTALPSVNDDDAAPTAGNDDDDGNDDDAVADDDDASSTDAAADDDDDATDFDEAAAWAAYRPATAQVLRLTQVQFETVLLDLFGDAVVIPPVLLADLESSGFTAIGASEVTLSPRTIEDLERATRDLAKQALSPELRADFIECEPASTRDDACAQQFITDFGRRAWRRALTDDERDRLVALAGDAASTLGDFYKGLEYALAALLQSPHFLFRREVSLVEVREGVFALDDFALASRLSFFLWNTAPDEELLAAAEAGELTDPDKLEAQVDRLLASPRARTGILNFFRDLYGLDELKKLSKDPTVFPAMSADLGPSALGETERLIEHLVFTENADFRQLLTTNLTFVDRRLAALYGVTAPTRDGYAPVRLPPGDRRRGLLGQVGFLALASHPVSTSPTLRGKFIKEKLLCSKIPAPPADVDTSIPEPSGDAVTLRDRIAEHLTNPTCAGCHELTDPLGLGLENFDGIGVRRTRENGATIDASGEFEGKSFTDAWDLAPLIAESDRFAPCLVQNLIQYGTGRVVDDPQKPAIEALTNVFAKEKFRVLGLIRAFTLSDAFRLVGPVANLEDSATEVSE